MIEPLLQTQLEPVAQRQRAWRFWRALTQFLAVLAGVGLLLILFQRSTGVSLPFALPLLGFVALIGAFFVRGNMRQWLPDFRQMARDIEGKYPSLHSLLVTAVEQKPDPQTGKYHYLQQRVVDEAVARTIENGWVNTVSDGQLFKVRAAGFAALAALVAVLFGLRGTTQAVTQGKRLFATAADVKVTVTPGDASVERGSGVVVMARFDGKLPAEAALVIGANTNDARRYPLTKNLDDPVFGGSIPEVGSNLTYRIEYDGRSTRDFKITVFEFPTLEQADAQITFPDYTGVSKKTVENTRRVSAVEGSQLDYVFRLNKPIVSARWIAKDKSMLSLAVDASRPIATLTNFAITTNQTFELQLVDADGRTNKVPPQFVIEALPNRKPDLKFVVPKGDQRVSPIEEVAFQGEAWDDFGLLQYGLTYSMPGKEPVNLALGTNAPANEKRPFAHLLKLEDLKVEPDQLISYFLWADDVGPDGKVRRTASDMFFAEVRPFEEIFREAPPQDASSQAQQSEGAKLAEIQKQIISATWKLKRQETGPKVSPQYAKDATVVKDSQEQVLEQLRERKSMAQDPRLQTIIDSAEKNMEKALVHLGEAPKSPEPLAPALEAEQAAYQDLLKLAAREYLVSRSRNQQGGGGGGQRNQAQLDQLELKDEEKRYETQSQASPQQSAAQREQQQVMNRLKELAQRQQDINEKIKELQTALQEAKTDAEREELKRRLKRLREEEQQMLADVDELRQRMERGENQARTAEARQQLEQTRREVQRTAEALERENVSQALTEGTRAERELEQLRDEYRKRTSNQFAEEMRQMRQDARQLAQNQEDAGKRLESMAENKQRRLSDSDEKKELLNQLARQKDALTNLVDRARGVSERAETSEPLLSKQLYDTIRQNSQNNPENSLDMTQELLKRNFAEQAGQTEQRAREQINELKRGVEKAAESVLGDDREALRLAKRELDALTDQLNREIEKSEPSEANEGEQQSASAQQPGQQPQPGQQGQRGQRGQRGQAGQQGQQPGEEQGQQPGLAQNQNQDGQPGAESQQQGQPAQRPGDRAQQGQRGQRGQQLAQRSQRGQQPGQGQTSEQQDQQGQEGQQGEQGQDGQQGQQGQRGQRGQQAQAGQQGQQGQQGQGQGQGQQPGQQQAQQPGQQGQEGQQGQQAQQAQQGRGQGTGRQGQQAQQQARANPQRGTGPQGGQPTDRDLQQAGDPRQRGQQPRGGQRAGGLGGGDRAQPGLSRNVPDQGIDTFAPQSEPAGEGPLTGREFTNWSDRLRDVEELIDLPELRTDVARAREQARQMRAEFKRHSKTPQWDLARAQILNPLTEVRKRVAEELAKRETDDALVPIDRDPVPNRYSELVRRYYEKLGTAEADRRAEK